MYAASGDRGVDGTTAEGHLQGPSHLPSHGLRAFADNASVIVVNPSGDALTAVASTLLNTKVLV